MRPLTRMSREDAGVGDLNDPNGVQSALDLIRASALFDPDWYTARYADVAMVGLDPAEHYLKYGGTLRRDPGPAFSTGFYLDARNGRLKHDLNPLVDHLLGATPIPPHAARVLLAAHGVAQAGDAAQAVRLAEENLPPRLAHTIEMLRANQALDQGDEVRWLDRLNAYLGHFGLARIALGEGPDLFSRLRCDIRSGISGGPLVSVIMPAWNAEATVEAAVRSILNQSWRNLELLVVDDASTDRTGEIVKRIAATDARVKLFRNDRNLGPYVSKNLALGHATGAWITGHDADDWAHPQRLENHVVAALSAASPLSASLTNMVRMKASGAFSITRPISPYSFDGVAQKAMVSCLYERTFLTEQLGYWDCVRFGADSEMLTRAATVLGSELPDLRQVTMLCLDLDSSLTNDAEMGVRGGVMSAIRAAYMDSFRTWLKNRGPEQPAYLAFPAPERRYAADARMIVDYRA